MTARASGGLGRLVTLEEFVAAPDGGGGSVGAWRALGRFWARLDPVSPGALRVGEAEQPTLTHRATVRWRPDGAPSRPRPGQRLREGVRVFAVEGVAEIDAGRRWLACWLREEVRP